jgi:hypothetical protein
LFTLVRRLPVVFAMHRFIHQIEEKRQAIFVGFFGPIGVSAIFYLYIALEFLETITVDGVIREDAETLSEVMMVVVWFLAICSIVVHGLSIPLGKLGFFLPRTLSRAFTSSQGNDEPEAFPIGERVRSGAAGVLRERRKRRQSPSALSGQSTPTNISGATSARPIYRIGGTVIRDRSMDEAGESREGQPVAVPESSAPSTPPTVAVERTIRFPDEEPPRMSLQERERLRDI